MGTHMISEAGMSPPLKPQEPQALVEPSDLMGSLESGAGGPPSLFFAPPDRMIESARYAVLNRLAPMLRHDVAGALQPLGMTTALLQKRLMAAEPDMAAIAKNGASVHVLGKEAAATCLGVMGWLAPKGDEIVSARAGAQELLSLMETELFLHGLASVNEIPDGEVRFARLFFRGAFAAALLALCDHCASAGSVHVAWHELHGEDGLCLRFIPDALMPPAQPVRRQRRIGWDDVQALATATGVACAQGDHWVALQLPINGPPVFDPDLL
jgi:hypothetical protein